MLRLAVDELLVDLVGKDDDVLLFGLDFFEGLDSAHPLDLHTWLQESFDLRAYTVSHFSKALEELLEMCSIAMLLALFLLHLLEQ